jgi:hypothetical protein
VTVVLGFVTPDAALMAADSESTEADGTRRDVDKIWTCGRLLLGHTGTSIIRQPLRAALDARIPELEAAQQMGRWEYRTALCQAANNVFGFEYTNHVGARGGDGIPNALRGALLAIGRDDDGHWLLEVDHTAGGSFYTDAGFHTVGSGSVAAQVGQAVLAHYEPLGRTVAHLRLIAYRTVAACIGTLGGGHGVGGEVRMWQADGDGFQQLSQAELEGVENGVAQWITVEAESLDTVVTVDEGADEQPPEGESMPDAITPA